ncbi:hypothetical protein [Helicobacter cynogastricus]|nr:hypothetical protein [Helicobacter cynogastricus]
MNDLKPKNPSKTQDNTTPRHAFVVFWALSRANLAFVNTLQGLSLAVFY